MAALTTQEAIDKLVTRVTLSARLDQMDNAITPPSPEEIALAVEDSINAFNSYLPMTAFAPEDFYNVQKYVSLQTLITTGALMFVAKMLVWDISANLIDVSVDDFVVTSKLQEYQALETASEELFNSELAQKKPLIGATLVGRARTTALSYGTSGWVSPATQTRYCKSIRGGISV